jgi:hypothetical protein
MLVIKIFFNNAAEISIGLEGRLSVFFQYVRIWENSIPVLDTGVSAE